jgi:hypothetical protein
MPGPYRGRRLVLREPGSEHEVDECAEVIKAQKIEEVTKVVEVGLSREVTWRLPGDNYLHYGREHPYGIAFVLVSGEEAEDVEELTGMMSNYFEPLTDADLLDGVDTAVSVEDLRAKLVRAGIGAAQSADEMYVERITAAMGDWRPRVREGGLWAGMYALWPELYPLVEHMAQEDPEQFLREQAAVLAKHLREGGIVPVTSSQQVG